MKAVKKCSHCVNICKVMVHSSVWENAEVVSCPTGKKYKKNNEKKK